MPKYKIPPNAGKVRVAMGTGGTYVVWNGKQGKNEFSITVRTRKRAEELAKLINSKKHNGEVEVWH
jgi:shikimate 5-dehydrogenase